VKLALGWVAKVVPMRGLGALLSLFFFPSFLCSTSFSVFLSAFLSDLFSVFLIGSTGLEEAAAVAVAVAAAASFRFFLIESSIDFAEERISSTVGNLAYMEILKTTFCHGKNSFKI